ncbi:MAG: hypothetical protein HUU57_06960 [Bdellovibrio sp.]|nr:hypothetical protein [Bdellovibrio sp.]
MKYFLSLFLLLSGCASSQIAAQMDYASVVEKNSDSIRRYSGFYNTLDMEATILNSEVAAAQLSNGIATYQWDDKKQGEEKTSLENRLSKEAEFFLSFFTPERKNDDLSRPATMWKIFLDVDGKRFEGKAKKIKLQLAEIQALYPYHNRFYTPYTVTFPVSMRAIEGKPMKLTLTGPVGSGSLNFPRN